MVLPAFTDITRADAEKILSSQKASDIIDVQTVDSVVLNTFETIRMSKRTYVQPMLASLPSAEFVGEGATGDGNVKPTTDMSWTDKSMTAEEIAVIVPIHENILADADIDIFAAVRPKIAEAFALRLDAAVLYGYKAPTTWTDADIVGKAITANNAVTRTSSSKLDLDFNNLIAAVENDEYDVTDVFTVKRLRSQFRALRDTVGQPVYLQSVRDDGRTDSIYGASLRYIHKRLADPVTARATNPVEAIAIDRSQFQVGIREDLQVKILTEATVGGVNLAERDMVALRFKFRVAFGSFRTPLLHDGSDYPASVLRGITVA